MALSDAQAKIINQNRKKREEEAARKLAADMLANQAKKKAAFSPVTPTKAVQNQVQTLLKSGVPASGKKTTKKVSPILADMMGNSDSLGKNTNDRGQLHSPLDIIRERTAIGDSAQTLAYRARQQDNGDWQDNLKKAAEQRVKRQEELSKLTLSDSDLQLPIQRQQMIREAKSAWQKAKDAGDRAGMTRAHAKAENVRGWAGYSGGIAGDEYNAAQLTRYDTFHLNQAGQTELKKAMIKRQRAIEAGDIQAQMAASAKIQRIRNNPNYKNKADNVDAYGRPMMTGEERLEDAARAMAGAKSVGTGVAGSLLSLAETGNQAMRNYTRDRWGHVLEANANQYRDPLLAQKARARLGESTIVDPNLPGQSLMRKSQEYANEALEGTSGVEKFLGETALSIGQNLPGIALSMIPGAQGAGLALLGAQAAGARAWELNEQSSQAFLASLILGGDPEDYGSVEAGEALLRGLASGGVELLTEKIPLDNLAKILRGKSGQNGLKSILKQMGMEGVEEGAAYTANFLLDKAAQDPNAEWTVEEFLNNVAMGAVSGGAMAGGATALRGAAEASRYAPSSTQTKERTVESVMQNQEIQGEEPEAVEDTTAQKAAEAPVAAPVQQAEPVATRARAEHPVQASEAQVAAPAQKKGKQVKLKRIEAIPAEVEVVQSKRVTTPVVSANYLSEMSSTLGKSGSKAMQVAWDGKGNQAQYAADFIRVYNQALTGTSTGRIQAPDSLSDAQVKAAYDAGKNDRQLSLEEAKTAAQFAPVAGKDSGLVYDDYVKAEMDTAVASEINTVAKQLGLRVQMVDSVKGGDANADIQGSVVSIEKGNPHPVRFLFGHEMTHRVQTLAPESYREFRDFVMSSPKAQDEVQRKLAAYKSRGVDIDSEGAIDEIVADYAGQLIESKDLMKRFIDQNRKNQSMLSRFLTALKDLAAKLTGRRKAQVNDAVSLLEKAVGEASKQAKKLEKGGNASQTGMVYDDGNGHSRYSLKTYREGGRDTLGRWLADRVKAGDLDGRDAKDMIKEMDRIYDICEKYTDVYAPFGKWSEAEVVRDDNGDPVFSVVKANGDYPMNMDFSLVCKKRRPLDAVLNSLVEQGLAEKFALDKESIVMLNDIIRRHGFETACSLCFVDAKRFRVTEVADQFASMYNRLVRSMVPKGKDYQVASFNFGGDKTVKKVSGGIDTMQDGDLNFKELEKTIRTTGEKSVAHKIAVHLRDNPADRKLVRRGDFISTAGFDRVKKDNPALLSLYNSKKGSAGPKASFSDVQYLSEVLEQKFFKRDAAYAVGGVRIQSFSDYMPRLFFDYAQMIADLAAKKLPAHGYTKEALFAQQFGQTGVKINLSLVPKVVEGGVAPGLDANGNYVWQEGQSFGSAVSDKDNGKAGFDLAVQIQNAEGYGDNCGTIAVGVSDRHIEKMLDDPDIRMIIPYHKSGLNPVVAAMNKIDKFENYTNYQNTRSKKTGKKVDAHFDFNTELQKLGDAKAAADAYLAWCEENGYLPKFDIPNRKFFPSQHPNYYKLLIDFSAYNSDGKATPQGDVRIQYPQEGDAFGSLNGLIKQGLEEDALAQAKLDKGVQPILDDVEKELAKKPGARYSLKANDQAYLAAVERGDMETAQKMVDEAAKAAGYTVETYHGTDKEFTVFETMYRNEFGYHVGGEKAAKSRVEFELNPKIMRLYTKLGKTIQTTDVFGYFAGMHDYIFYVRGEMDKIEDLDFIKQLGRKKKLRNKFPENEILEQMHGAYVDFHENGYKGSDARRVVELTQEYLKSIGVDSVSYKNAYEDAGSTSYLLLHPEQVKLADPVTYDDSGNVIPLSERFNEGNPDIRHSLKGISGYENLVEKFGAIERGEDPRARDIQVPQQTEEGKKVSRTVRTILEAGSTTDEMVPTIKKMVEDGEFSYEVAGDKAAIETAEATIRDKGFQAALMDWTSSLAKGEVNKQNVATGWALYDAAAQAGDAKTAADIMTRIVIHQRNAAQAVQATRILKRMSPSAQLYGIQRSVQNMQEELTAKYGDKAPNLKVPDELIERYLNAENQEERDDSEIEIYKSIGKQMPSTFRDKWNAWRYLAMLFNVRTHVRNVSGNAFFALPVMTKNFVGVGLEGIGSVVSGGKMERTKGIYGPELFSAAWKDYKKSEGQIMAGGKYDDSAAKRDIIRDSQVVFDWKILAPVEWLRRFNSGALQAEDGWFCKPHYANALAQYCAANGITAEQVRTGEGVSKKDLDKARAYAIKEAQKATYRDFNEFSDFIGSVGRYSGDSKVKKAFSAIVEGVLPFRKTPANILVRAVEYSPIGLASGIWELTYGVKSGKNTAAEALDRLASGMTGSGLFALGFYLASQGLIVASGSGDDEQDDYDDLLGRQNYSIEMPDGTNFTIDWLSPECIPVFMGAEFFKAKADKEATGEFGLTEFLSSMTRVTNPMLEMSCLSSLNDLFDNLSGFKQGDVSSLVVVAANMAISYLTQGVPTLLGQAERASQEDRMTTYTDKNDDLPTDWQYTIGKTSARIPKWDYNQIPYIDAWGRTESEASKGKRIVNNFINPAYTSKYYVSQMEAELQRLYDVIGDEEDVRILPSRADRYFNVDGARVDLTAEQYVTYAKEKGQRSYALMQKITTSSWYAGADDAVKAEVISNAYQVANEDAKKALFPDYVSKNNVYLKAAAARDEEEMAAGDYLYLYAITGDVESLKYKSGSDAGETISNSKSYQIAEKIYDSPIVLTDSQRAFVYEAFGVGKTAAKANSAKVKQELATMRKQAGL